MKSPFIILLLIFVFPIAHPQTNNLSSLKIGMKDDQVEKLVGLPMEIFKGFPEYTGDDVEVKGQLNYICWRYKYSKRIIIDTISKDLTEEREVFLRYDTVFIINEWRELKPWECSRIYRDTIYTYREHITSSVIEKYDYDQAMLYSSEKDKYNIVPITSKKIKIDTVTELQTFVVGIEKYVRFLTFNQCVLFDPSSNRVVNVDYYPTKYLIEKIRQKKIKGK